jgi:tRNA-dihydrouridine synthase B
LFEDLDSLRAVLKKARSRWPHVLTAKIRLGRQRPDWQPRFVERLRLQEESGVDAIILNPRFFEEKNRRRARHELFPWAASLTRLPLIANGDLIGPGSLQPAEHFQSVSAIMLGRMAVARPWVFATWDGAGSVDLAAIWHRMCEHVIEDFPPTTALRRLKMFTKYFASNFKFGHQFNVDLSQAPSLEEIQRRAGDFFSRAPVTVAVPNVAGL